jgi:hypothetical protein
MKPNPMKKELHTIRLQPSVTLPWVDRRAYLNVPDEFYSEDLDAIKKFLDALYLEPRPQHTPNHDAPCPACTAKAQSTTASKEGE